MTHGSSQRYPSDRSPEAREESRGIPPFILNLGALEMSGQHHIPAVLSSGKDPGIHLTGGWVCPKDGRDVY